MTNPKMPPGSTIVALPYVSKVGFTGATVQSIITGMTARGFPNCKFLFIGDACTHDARNIACRDALEEGADYLFFIDSDMDFPTVTLQRLKEVDADIACTDMWSRGWPSFRTVQVSKPDGKGGLATHAVPIEESHPFGPEMPGVVLPIDVCGMACTLIKTSLLRRMQEHFTDQPWFWAARHGEDATFCFNAKEIGATIKCDFGICAGHWGVTRMAGQDYTRDARNQPMSIANPEFIKRMGVLGLPKPEGESAVGV